MYIDHVFATTLKLIRWHPYTATWGLWYKLRYYPNGVSQNIKLFNKDLTDVVLKASWCVEITKEYDLVTKVAVASTKSRLSFITFSDFYPIVYTSQV